MYTELLNKYVSLLEKIYLISTTKYCQELIKLIFIIWIIILLNLLWVKFDQIFKSINEQIFKSSNKNPKLLNNGIHSVTHKIGELLSIVNLISKNTTNTPMILIKIKEIQKQFNEFFSILVETIKYNR